MEMDEQSLHSMPLDKFKQVLQGLKQQYDVMEATNITLQEKLHRTKKRELRILEDNKQALVSSETHNMMSKYQMVFVKMENIFSKVFSAKKHRDRICK